VETLIGISMLTLRPGQVGGSETYARSLAAALAEHGRLAYVCFVPPVATDAGDGLETVVVPEFLEGRQTATKAAAMGLAAIRAGRIRRRFGRISAMHYPFTIPLPPARAPTAISLQDVLHHDEPRLFGRAERLFRRFAYDRPARRADLVLVPTDHVRERICEQLGVRPERVRTIHHAVDHATFRPGPEEPEPYLFYPAKAWPHKNHQRLFAAFARFRSERPEFRLVLTGGSFSRPLPEGVDARGHVPAVQLPALYRRASALVFPSLHEGFGLPVLEAMASGCPVAASTAGSLPEVCGDAAVLFDPRDPESIANGIGRAVDERDSLRPRGLARAAQFTWAAAARGHDAAYAELTDY